MIDYAIMALMFAAPVCVISISLWAEFGIEEKRRAYQIDLVALVLAPAAFLLAAFFRGESGIGFYGFIGYPIFIAVGCSYAFGAKVVFLNPRLDDARRSGFIFVTFCVIVAMILGLTVPTWYE